MKKDNIHKLMKTYDKIRQYLNDNNVEYTEPTTSSLTISTKNCDAEELEEAISGIIKESNNHNVIKTNLLDGKLYVQFKCKF